MKRYFFLAAILLTAFSTQAQGNKHWVFFEDKGPEAEWHAAHPENLLTPRSLERRTRMGLPVDHRDVPVSKTYLGQLEEAGVQVTNKSKWLNAASVETHLSFQELRQVCPQITDMRPVGTYVAHNESDFIPLTDPEEDEESTASGMFSYGQSEDQVFQIGAECLHDSGYTGKDILIAVFDAGFMGMDTMAAFDSVYMNNRVQAVWDFVDGDTDLYAENWHGMSVASCIVANLPGQYVGTAPHASLLLARTETVFEEVHQEEDNWLAAVEWADSLGADMIQSSLGYTTFDAGEGDYTYQDLNGDVTIITKAADIAADKGILVVSSAGNAGNSPWHYITAPCDADSILCVGAVDGLGMRASFSSVGPTADGRIKPDVMAWGSGASIIGISGNVGYGSGTSFSAPIACGMVACLLEAHPMLNNMQVINAVNQSGDRYASPDTAYGHGIPNACKADSVLDVLDSLAMTAAVFADPDRYFRFYPNPVQGELFVDQIGLGWRPAAIEVYTSDGQLVMRENEPTLEQGRYTLNTNDLAPGFYLLKLNFFENRTISHKFIRQ